MNVAEDAFKILCTIDKLLKYTEKVRILKKPVSKSIEFGTKHRNECVDISSLAV